MLSSATSRSDSSSNRSRSRSRSRSTTMKGRSSTNMSGSTRSRTSDRKETATHSQGSNKAIVAMLHDMNAAARQPDACPYLTPLLVAVERERPDILKSNEIARLVKDYAVAVGGGSVYSPFVKLVKNAAGEITDKMNETQQIKSVSFSNDDAHFDVKAMAYNTCLVGYRLGLRVANAMNFGTGSDGLKLRVHDEDRLLQRFGRMRITKFYHGPMEYSALSYEALRGIDFVHLIEQFNRTPVNIRVFFEPRFPKEYFDSNKIAQMMTHSDTETQYAGLKAWLVAYKSILASGGKHADSNFSKLMDGSMKMDASNRHSSQNASRAASRAPSRAASRASSRASSRAPSKAAPRAASRAAPRASSRAASRALST